MGKLYNVYYAGQVLDGYDITTVRDNLAKLFKASDQTLEKLFSGQPQLLKRDCAPEQARKYKAAMERAGALPILRTLAGPDEDSPANPDPSAGGSSGTMTAADKIAALAAAADQSPYSQDGNSAGPGSDGPASSGANAGATTTESTSSASTDTHLDVAPAGTEVLKEHERSQPVQANIDTSEYSIDLNAERLSDEASPPPPAPDVSHLEMGEVGDTIPTLDRNLTPLDPDTSALDLSPEGTDFSDCVSEKQIAPDLDLSGIEVAPEGSGLLSEEHRRKDTPQAPVTDHISLED